MATLRIIAGPSVGTTFPLGQTQILGRDARCDLALADAATSRQHARLYVQGERYWIVDLNSANGIRIDGERIERAELPSGARFQLGQTVFEIQYDALARKPEQKTAAARADEGLSLRGASADRILRSERRQKSRGPDLFQIPAGQRFLMYLLAVLLAAGITAGILFATGSLS